MCQAQGGWMSAKPDRGLTPPSFPHRASHSCRLEDSAPAQARLRRGCRRPGKTSVLCPPLHPAFSSGWVCGSFLKDVGERCGLRGPGGPAARMTPVVVMEPVGRPEEPPEPCQASQPDGHSQGPWADGLARSCPPFPCPGLLGRK